MQKPKPDPERDRMYREHREWCEREKLHRAALAKAAKEAKAAAPPKPRRKRVVLTSRDRMAASRRREKRGGTRSDSDRGRNKGIFPRH